MAGYVAALKRLTLIQRQVVAKGSYALSQPDLNKSPPFRAQAIKLRGGTVAEWKVHVKRLATIWEYQALVGESDLNVGRVGIKSLCSGFLYLPGGILLNGCLICLGVSARCDDQAAERHIF